MAGTELSTELSPALIGLISSVELSNSDWWPDALGRSVTFALWLEGRPLTLDEVRQVLLRELDIRLTPHEAEEQSKRLRLAGALVELEDSRVKITEDAARGLIADMEATEAVEMAARDVFETFLSEYVSDAEVETAWVCFNDDLLAPLIRELGVKTYRFLQGKPFDLRPSTLLDKFLRTLPTTQRDGMEATVLAFLDPNRKQVREYVINRLTTHLFLQASRWPRETLEYLAKAALSQPTFVVFLDTNLLFSILDIHYNPANEAAIALADLRESLAGLVSLKLYVTTDTIQEAKASLQSAAEAYRGIVLTPAVVAGTSSIQFSGLGQRFIEQAAHPDGVRQSYDYFQYYIDNLLLLAKSRGVELYNEDLSPLHTAQEVIDDIESATEVQNRHRQRRGLREKTYEQIRHDVVLWHFVRSKRDAYVESPLQARYWAVTADYSLLGFDAFKSQRRARTVPVCLHPTGLIQMLRFWIPRGDNVDSAMLRSLRMPFLFFKYDVALEQATVSILRAIGRFEKVDRLSAEAIADLVTNKELRRRMGTTEDMEAQTDMVRLEFVEQEADLRQRLRDSEDQARALERTLEGARQDVHGVKADLAETDTLRWQAENRARRAESRAARLRVTLFLIACALLAALPIAGLVLLLWVYAPATSRVITVVAAAVLWVSTSLLATGGVARRFGSASDSAAVDPYRRFNRWLWTTAIFSLVLGVVGTAIYDSARGSENPRQVHTHSHSTHR